MTDLIRWKSTTCLTPVKTDDVVALFETGLELFAVSTGASKTRENCLHRIECEAVGRYHKYIYMSRNNTAITERKSMEQESRRSYLALNALIAS